MRRLILILWFASCATAGAAQDCAVRDFQTLPLPDVPADPVAAALTLAYPGIAVTADAVITPAGSVPRLPARGLTGAAADPARDGTARFHLGRQMAPFRRDAF
jgi:hypothetical protein